MSDRHSLYFGEVMHARTRPACNRFRYPVFFLRVRVDAVDDLRRPLLSVNRWNLFSFNLRDHGARDGSPLRPWIVDLLAREGLAAADGEVWLHTFPRMLGFVFNPVSFWLCHDRAGKLRAVLAEVNNTFGERHNYLVAHDDQRPIEPRDELVARKVFHVSPFCEVRGTYKFRFAVQPTRSLMRIDYDDSDGALLATAISGSERPLTTANLLRAFCSYPWMTLGVMLRIHWQALRLWWKGVPFFRKPPLPVDETTR